jgi:hypothetical protein
MFDLEHAEQAIGACNCGQGVAGRIEEDSYIWNENKPLRKYSGMADLQVICPECGKRVSLRGLNGHLRFEHEYNLDQAKRMAASARMDGSLRRLEEDVMVQVRRLSELRQDAELLRQAREDGLMGEALFERLITQKGHERTAATRYLQNLEESWSDRVAERTGVRPTSVAELSLDETSGIDQLLGAKD